MATRLEQFREQYPQYAQIDDDTLAKALYEKYYAGKIPEADYRQQIGLPPLKPLKPVEAPTRAERIEAALGSAATKLKAKGGQLLNDVGDFFGGADESPEPAAKPAAPLRFPSETTAGLSPQTEDEIQDYLDQHDALVRPTTPAEHAERQDRTEDSWGALGLHFIKSLPSMFEKAGGGIVRALAEAEPTAPNMMVANDPAWQAAVAQHRELVEAASKAGTLPGQKLYESAEQDLKRNAPRVDPDSLKGYAYDIAQIVAALVPALAVGALTHSPRLGLSLLAAQTYGETYGHARETGRTKGQATADAAFYSLAQSIPADMLLSAVMKPSARFMPHLMHAAGAGALQAIVTTALNLGYQKGVLKQDMTWGDAVKALERAGIVGTAAGGVLAAGTHAAGSVSKLWRRAVPATPGVAGEAAGPETESPPPPPQAETGAERSPSPEEPAPSRAPAAAESTAATEATPPVETYVEAIHGPGGELDQRAGVLNPIVENLNGAQAQQAAEGIGARPRDLSDPVDYLLRQHPDDIEAALRAVGKWPSSEASDKAEQGTLFASRPSAAAGGTRSMAAAPNESADVRLHRAPYRVALAGLADQLPTPSRPSTPETETAITEETPQGRAQPAWFAQLQAAPETRVTAREARRAVGKALNGQKLGIREARVVGAMLNHITGQRQAEVPAAREELERARVFRRNAREALERPMPPPETFDHAGDELAEGEYDAGADGEERSLLELYSHAEVLGQRQRATAILRSAPSNDAAAEDLQELIDEHTHNPPGAGPDTQARSGGPQDHVETPAGVDQGATRGGGESRLAGRRGAEERRSGESGQEVAPVIGADGVPIHFGQAPNLFEKPPVPVTVAPDVRFASRDDVLKWALNAKGGDLRGRGPYRNEDTGWKIRVSRDGLEKTTSQSKRTGRLHIDALPALPELLRHAVLGETKRNEPREGKKYNPHIVATHRFFAPLELGGELYRAKLTVHEYRDGRKFYDQSLIELQKAQSPTEGGASRREPERILPPKQGERAGPIVPATSDRLADHARESSSTISVVDLLAGVKRDDGEPYAPERRAGDDRRATERRARVKGLSLDEQIEELYKDPLTGLYNRKAFDEAAKDAPAVASIDADNLKPVNDELGHEGGDALLKAIARAMQNTGLEAFRTGGDEFHLIGDSERELEDAVATIKAELGQQVVETENGKLKGIHVSAGIGRTKKEADDRMEAGKRAYKASGKHAASLADRLVLNANRPIDMNAGTNYVPLINKMGDLPLNANHEYMLGDGRTVRIPKQPIRKRHATKLLERKLGTKIYQGRVKGPKTRLGFYRLGVGEIRTRYKADLEVTAHEFSHWLDDRYPWIAELYKKFRHEILAVSYDDTKDYEGWAEFGRLWLTQDYEARRAAPGFYDAWHAALEKRPELRDKLFEIQELMHAWYLQGARARLASKHGKDKLGIRQWTEEHLNEWDSKMLQSLFDDLRRFKEAERDVRGELGDATLSGYKSFRLARGASGTARAIIKHGTANWDQNGDLVFTGKGLEHVLAPIEDRKEDWALYGIARRAAELTGQGRENAIRPDEIAAGLDLARQDPELAAVFDDWLQFDDRFFDFVEASGLVSHEGRLKIQSQNRDYLPFNRIVDTITRMKLGQRVKRGGGTPMMRLKGGTSNINDVFENITKNIAYLTHMALINRAKQNFYGMLEQADNQTAALYAVPIAKDVKPISVDRDQVLRVVLESLGLDMKWYRHAATGVVASEEEAAQVRMVDEMANNLDDFVLFWQHGIDPKGNVDFYWKDGKKVFWEIGDPLLFDAIQHIGPQAHNLAVNILGGFSTVLRRGVTATPQFQIRNFLRDTTNAVTLSRGSWFLPAPALKALTERIFNDEHYWEYVLNGGGFVSMQETGGIAADRLIDTPGKALEAYDRFLAAFEYANRVAEYKTMRKRGASRREAALAGREISTDFGMRGSSAILRLITIAHPFLNARLEGLYRIAREIGELRGPQYGQRPTPEKLEQNGGALKRVPNGRGGFKYVPRVRLGDRAFTYALRSLVAITIPSLWLYFTNRRDRRYQEMPNYIRDLNWVVFYGDGEDDYFVIPKPFETGMLWGTIPERAVEYHDTHDGGELAHALEFITLQVFNLQAVPQAFEPLYDLATNQSWTGAPIIPEYMQTLEPSEQQRAYTSDAMIALGRKLDISPLKAQYLVRGYFGTLGTWALGAADYMVGDVNGAGAEPTRGWQDNFLLSSFVNQGPLRRTHSEDEFYELLKATRRITATFNEMRQSPQPERAAEYLQDPRRAALFGARQGTERVATEAHEFDELINAVILNKTMPADQKRVAIDQIQGEKNALMHGAMATLKPAIKEAVNAQ